MAVERMFLMEAIIERACGMDAKFTDPPAARDFK
ncbi:hypothetical protein ACVWXS_004891 [Lysinibacillus sp. TE18511]